MQPLVSEYISGNSLPSYPVRQGVKNLKNRSLLEIHAAVLLFGLAGLFGKLILLPPTIIVLGRVFFASIFLFPVLLYFGGVPESLNWQSKTQQFP